MDPKMQEIFDKVASAAMQVGEGAKRGAKKAGQKAGQFWDAGKVRVKLIELRNAEKDLYEELGRKIYGIRNGEEKDKEAIEAIFEKIDAIAAERAGYENKGISFCTKCGAEIAEGAQFCSKCGAAVKTEEPTREAEPEAEAAPEEEAQPEQECCCGEEKTEE